MTPKEIKDQPVCISLEELYRTLFRMDKFQWDSVEVSLDLWNSIVDTPQIDTLIHAEPYSEVSVTLWRKEAWLADAAYRFKQQENSDERRRLHFLKEEATKIMVKELRDSTGMDKDNAILIISGILHKKDLKNARRFGLGENEEKWKELFT